MPSSSWSIQSVLPDMAVLVLNWNGWQDTVECLDSLRRSVNVQAQIIVLDNGSTDGSVERICAWAEGNDTGSVIAPDSRQQQGVSMTVIRYTRDHAILGGDAADEQLRFAGVPSLERLVVIENGDNLGFAAGNNIGIRYALQRGYRLIMLLNNDTVVESSALAALSACLSKHSDCVGVTGQIRYYDAPIIWNCGGDLTWFGNRRYHHHGKPYGSVPATGGRKISFMTGCAALFPSQFFRDYGLLTERFFFGEEDYELSLRVKQAHLAFMCCYDAVIYHKVGRSIRKRAGEQVLRSNYIYHLSRSIDLRTYWSRPRWQMWRHLSWLYTLIMLRIRYAISWRALWALRTQVLRDSNALDQVDRNTFEDAMQKEFR